MEKQELIKFRERKLRSPSSIRSMGIGKRGI